jgi:hypothetical protein
MSGMHAERSNTAISSLNVIGRDVSVRISWPEGCSKKHPGMCGAVQSERRDRIEVNSSSL